MKKKQLVFEGPPVPCDVCDRTVPIGAKHPCRFEIACSCWRNVPCDGSGRIKRWP